MKQLSIFALFLLLGTYAQAQVALSLKTEYIGRSSYYDRADGEKIKYGKGDAQVHSIMLQIPVSMTMDEYERPRIWAVGLGGSYTNFGNKDIPSNFSPREILNTHLALTHIRSIHRRWSVLANVGVGTFTPSTHMSDMRMSNTLMSGGLVFVYHWKPNLDIGGGLAVNTSLGYPMAFPAIYLKWGLAGKYEVDVQLGNAMEIAAGVALNENVKLKAIFTANGAMAFNKIEDKKKIFSHQYMVPGIQPVFTFGEINIPVTLGVTVSRMAHYQDRTLKSLFSDDEDKDKSNFGVSPYAAVGFNVSF